MQTVISQETGVSIVYPCTVHLLHAGELLECEYRSDEIGRDLLEYVCSRLELRERELWGLRFFDTCEQRNWLDMDKPIRPQLWNVTPTHFQFRVKVYPPEPYALEDQVAKLQIFMQLRFDLLSGRLSCGPYKASLFIATLLQYGTGDFDVRKHFGNYIKEKMVYNQCFTSEMKAMELHRDYMHGLNRVQAVDLMLRMACKLDTYGTDPYLIACEGDKSTLSINYRGFERRKDEKTILETILWSEVSKVSRDKDKVIVQKADDTTITYTCLTKAECKYIYLGAVAHFEYFISSLAEPSVVADQLEDDKSIVSEDTTVLYEGMDTARSETTLNQDTVAANRRARLSEKKKYLWWIGFVVVILGSLAEYYLLFYKDGDGKSPKRDQIVSLLRKHLHL